jgi:hypothetical protein
MEFLEFLGGGLGIPVLPELELIEDSRLLIPALYIYYYYIPYNLYHYNTTTLQRRENKSTCTIEDGKREMENGIARRSRTGLDGTGSRAKGEN